MKRKKKQRRLGSIVVLASLRKVMVNETPCWSSERISQHLKKSLPATRRYLRRLVALGLLIESRHYRMKYYALPELVAAKKEELRRR